MNQPSVIAELLRYGAQVNVKDQVSNFLMPEVYISLAHLKWKNLQLIFFITSKSNLLGPFSNLVSHQWGIASYLCVNMVAMNAEL